MQQPTIQQSPMKKIVDEGIKCANGVCQLVGFMFLILIFVNAYFGLPITFIVNEKPYTVDFTSPLYLVLLSLVFIFVLIDTGKDATKFIKKLLNR